MSEKIKNRRRTLSHILKGCFFLLILLIVVIAAISTNFESLTDFASELIATSTPIPTLTNTPTNTPTSTLTPTPTNTHTDTNQTPQNRPTAGIRDFGSGQCAAELQCKQRGRHSVMERRGMAAAKTAFTLNARKYSCL